MAWIAKVTDLGTALVRQSVNEGKRLVITKAVGGDGTTAASGLPALTDLPSRRQTLSVTSGGLRVQVASAGVSQGYQLRQIGVYARIEGGAEQLLFVAQNETGEYVPSGAEDPTRVMDFLFALEIGNSGSLTVQVNSNALVTTGQLQEAMDGAALLIGNVGGYFYPTDWKPLEDWYQFGYHYYARIRDCFPASLYPDLPVPVAHIDATEESYYKSAVKAGIAPFANTLVAKENGSSIGVVEIYAKALPDGPVICHCDLYVRKKTAGSAQVELVNQAGGITWRQLREYSSE